MAKEDEIKLIAYNIWEQEACPNGKDCEHWFRAEAMWEEQQKRERPLNNIPVPPNEGKRNIRSRHTKK